MSAPICMDCKHRRGAFAGKEFSKCLAPQRPREYRTDLVTGETVDFGIAYCSVIRGSKRQEMCGPEGRWFERKAPWWYWFLGGAGSWTPPKPLPPAPTVDRSPASVATAYAIADKAVKKARKS